MYATMEKLIVISFLASGVMIRSSLGLATNGRSIQSKVPLTDLSEQVPRLGEASCDLLLPVWHACVVRRAQADSVQVLRAQVAILKEVDGAGEQLVTIRH